MVGIDLDQMILYKNASLRFFKNGEYHVSRRCADDVLLLVYDGVLRFTEDAQAYEIQAGEYHIQRHGSVQTGGLPSDAPKYLYIHFSAHWGEGNHILPKSGAFSYAKFKTIMEEMDILAHSDAPYTLKAEKFYEILSELYRARPTANTLADPLTDYISRQLHHTLTLQQLCDEFHFSKNHIIHICKQTVGMTPIAYINTLRLRRAEYLMEVTSDTLESIAFQCGFREYSHFYRLFYRKHHLSPEQWRNLQRTE